jgi:hypothetical protein
MVPEFKEPFSWLVCAIALNENNSRVRNKIVTLINFIFEIFS